MEEVEEALSVRLGCFDDSLSINVELPNVAVKLPALAVDLYGNFFKLLSIIYIIRYLLVV